MKNPYRSAAISSVALTVLVGLETLRALQPQMAFLLRDRFGWHALEIGRLGVALFCVGFLAALVHGVLGTSRKLLVFGLALPLVRLALQAWRGDPVGDFILALSGVAVFFLLLPALVTALRPLAGGGGCLAVGWLLGQLGDQALHGLLGTWDLAWRDGWPALAAVAALCGGQAVSVLRFHRAWRRAGSPQGDLSAYAAWGWLGFGPGLFLYFAQLGNSARYGALLGASHGLAWMLIAAALVTALVVLTAWLRRGGSPGGLLIVPAVAFLVFLASRPWWTGAAAAAQLFAGTVVAALLWSVVLVTVSAGDAAPGLRRMTVAHGSSVLLFGGLVFVYGAAFDVAMPFEVDLVFAAAALVLGIAAFGAAGLLHLVTPRGQRGWRPWQAVALLLAAPAMLEVWPADDSPALEPRDLPLRVVTYNLHCGVDPRGDLDLEAFARVLEAADPDLVALQEVSRGWTVNGSVDMVEWLAERLGLHFVFAGTGNPLWGNAVLTRLPILSWGSVPLPSEGLLLRRGSLEVSLAHADGRSLRVIATHLHHPKQASDVRQGQVQSVLDLWRGTDSTVLLGDFNAWPELPEMQALRRAGFVDAFAAGARPGTGEGFTYSSWEPVRRIDYIYLSPDLVARDVHVPATTASDHLPVVATIDRK